MKKILYLAIILFAGLITSCKKDNKTSSLNLLKDSIYMFEKEDYLWNDAIPDYASFNPCGYTGSSDLTALSNELTAISQLKINPSTGKPYEYSNGHPGRAKYSFVDDGSTTSELNGVGADFGFGAAYRGINDIRITYVYPGSPADIAGLKRGFRITAINNNTNISYDVPPYGSGTSTNYNFVNNAIFNSNKISLTLNDYEGGSFSINNLSTANYDVNPVIKDAVYSAGIGHPVGYIVFNSFTALSNAQPRLDAAFNYFIAQGIVDLIVDLRTNGGGSGETAAYLDDLIVPTAKSGSLMYTTFANSNLQNDNHPLLSKKFNISPGEFKPQNNQVMFSKSLSLNLTRVFFLVSGNTASASELMINNLRPALPMQLIGDTTYGKPVGEIPIPIGKYYLYSPQFYVENSANQGDYYAGMAPGSASFAGVLTHDDMTTDFGDPNDALLAQAMNYIRSGAYLSTNALPKTKSAADAYFLRGPQSFAPIQSRNKIPLLLMGKKLMPRE